MRRYHERAKNAFELQCSWLHKLRDEANVWPQVIDISKVRPATVFGFDGPRWNP